MVARAATPAAGLLAVALLAAPATARPQAGGASPIDTAASPTVAGGRVLGMGGAFVAVAEGVAGTAVNPAAAAQRNPRLARGWDVDGLLTWYLPPGSQVARSDIDNDGGADGALTGTVTALLGGQLQLGRLGLAAVARGWALSRREASGDLLETGTIDTSLTVAWSACRDALAVGGGLTAASGSVAYTPAGGEMRESRYNARLYHLGVLWRPRARPWRVGVAWRSSARPGASDALAGAPVAPPPAFVVPWSLSAGLAVWLGANAERANEPPYVALARHPEWGEGPPHHPTSRSPVLLSLQLDLAGKTPGAIGPDAVLGSPVHPSGREPSLTPRLGAEWEPIPSWVRLRGGGYLEPSRSGAEARPHGTFGVEVKVPVPFLPWALQLSAGGDVAARYQNLSLSVGLWSELAPPPPAPRPAAEG